MLEEGATTCCYAQSEKSWITDPAGVPWEMFRTFDESTVYGDGREAAAGRLATATGRPVEAAPDTACCAPAVAEVKPAAKACCSSVPNARKGNVRRGA